MHNAGRQNALLYTKIIYQQQEIIKNHDHITIFGMTRNELDLVQDKLLALPGILSVNGSRKIHTIRKWNLLTKVVVIEFIIPESTRAHARRAREQTY